MRNRLTGSTFPIWRHATAYLLLLLITASCDNLAISTQPPATPSAGVVVREIGGTRTAATPGGGPDASPTLLIATPEPAPTLIPESERSEIFENVCQTVKDHYLYADFHGTNWEALCNKYRPKALTAANSPDFYHVIGEMVEQLKDDHSSYVAPWEAREDDATDRGDNHYVGIGISIYQDGDSVVIVQVFPNSPAERAGLRRRDRITAVDGKPLVKSKHNDIKILGFEGSTVHLAVRSPGQAPRDVAVVRHAITGKSLATGSRLKAEPSMGYLVIPDLWVNDMDSQVEGQLKELLDASPPLNGLVIDLRANEGGSRAVLQGILGQFVISYMTEKAVGHYYGKDESMGVPLLVRRGYLYDKLSKLPVVVLVDKGTESNAEVLAAVLQFAHRARVVGVTTAGNTESIYPYDQKDGSRLWLAEQGFELPDGTNLEGRGVVPDVSINSDWTEYTERNDPHILKAIELLKQGLVTRP